MNLNNCFCVYLVLLSLEIGCQAPGIIIDDVFTPNLDVDNPAVKKHPVVPDYYLSHICEKERRINDVIASAEGDYESFIFFTDAHWGDNQEHSPALINHVVYHTPIKDLIFGGDVITTYFDNPLDAISLGKSFREAFDTLSCNKYYLYGNHDNNSDCHPNDIERHLTDEQVYLYLQQGMSDCNYVKYFNFFYDRSESKTRFICLDTGRYYYTQFRNKTIETVDFLTNVLHSAPENWRIVVISHLWNNLDNGKPRVPYMPDYIKLFVKVLDDFNSSKKGTFLYNGESVEYDFSNSTAKIVCCIGGHCHIDNIDFSDGGIPIIITTTDSRQTVNNDNSDIGTINEQAFSVFVLDYKNQSVEMIRIGRGNDMHSVIS